MQSDPSGALLIVERPFIHVSLKSIEGRYGLELKGGVDAGFTIFVSRIQVGCLPTGACVTLICAAGFSRFPRAPHPAWAANSQDQWHLHADNGAQAGVLVFVGGRGFNRNRCCS